MRHKCPPGIAGGAGLPFLPELLSVSQMDLPYCNTFFYCLVEARNGRDFPFLSKAVAIARKLLKIPLKSTNCETKFSGGGLLGRIQIVVCAFSAPTNTCSVQFEKHVTVWPPISSGATGNGRNPPAPCPAHGKWLWNLAKPSASDGHHHLAAAFGRGPNFSSRSLDTAAWRSGSLSLADFTKTWAFATALERELQSASPSEALKF